MLNLLRSLILGLALLPIASGAVEVRDLFEAEVPVADQGPAARAEAIAGALQDVLVKVSGGSRKTSVSPAEAARYVQQYRYRQNGGLVLQVQFAPDAVKGLLQERGIPVWGGSRPLMLVWLAIEKRGQRVLVGANAADPERELVQSAGKHVGLPVRLPLLDLADRARVEPADIWGDFHQSVLEVSRRYNAQAILVGRMFPVSGGHWQARWSLYFGDQKARWSSDGSDTGAVIVSGMEGAADWLSRAFSQSVVAEGGDSMMLEVTGVADLAAYRKVLDYLQSLEGVSQVKLLQVDSGAASFELHAAGAMASVERTLALGDTLVPEEWQLEQGNRKGRLYRLVP